MKLLGMHNLLIYYFLTLCLRINIFHLETPIEYV